MMTLRSWNFLVPAPNLPHFECQEHMCPWEVPSGCMELWGGTCFSIVAFKKYGFVTAPNIALGKWYLLTSLEFKSPYQRMWSGLRLHHHLLVYIYKYSFLISSVMRNYLIPPCIRISNSSGWSDGPVSRQLFSDDCWEFSYTEQSYTMRGLVVSALLQITAWYEM